MIRALTQMSLVAATLVVAIGAAATASLFWLFLTIPESTIWTVAASVVMVLALYAVMALVLNAALLSWETGWSRALLRRAAAGVALTPVPLLLVLLSWSAFGAVERWLESHTGEISAWFIAQLNWSNVLPLIRGTVWICEWLRWLVVPFGAAAWLAHALRVGWPGFSSLRPIAHAWSPLRLAMATALFAACLWLPWAYLPYWVPRGLPPTWVEPLFAAVKFGGLWLVSAVGIAVLTRLAAR